MIEEETLRQRRENMVVFAIGFVMGFVLALWFGSLIMRIGESLEIVERTWS